MSDYLQRLIDRSAPPAASIAAVTPASRVSSPLAWRDQRLQDPDLATSLLASPLGDSQGSAGFARDSSDDPEPAFSREDTWSARIEPGGYRHPTATMPQRGVTAPASRQSLREDGATAAEAAQPHSSLPQRMEASDRSIAAEPLTGADPATITAGAPLVRPGSVPSAKGVPTDATRWIPQGIPAGRSATGPGGSSTSATPAQLAESRRPQGSRVPAPNAELTQGDASPAPVPPPRLSPAAFLGSTPAPPYLTFADQRSSPATSTATSSEHGDAGAPSVGAIELVPPPLPRQAPPPTPPTGGASSQESRAGLPSPPTPSERGSRPERLNTTPAKDTRAVPAILSAAAVSKIGPVARRRRTITMFGLRRR